MYVKNNSNFIEVIKNEGETNITLHNHIRIDNQ